MDDAVAILSTAPRARIVAGGSNLVDLMKSNVERPDMLVDINRLDDLRSITPVEGGGLRIGALVTNSAVAHDPQVTERYPLLASAILAGATPQLRNAATVGGNLNQRTRCYYFYDADTACNKREPGSGCPAIGGVNRIHAILGTSESCIATHPSDMCVALAALDASVRIAGPDGVRTIPFDAYHRLPEDRPEKDNTLLPGEMVISVDLPAAAAVYAGHHTYLKVRDRLSYAFALVSVAAALEIENGEVMSARLAVGGVAHKPWRIAEAEVALTGRMPATADFERLADTVLAGAQGFGHNDFKVELARRTIVRALQQAAASTPQSQTDKRIA